ncbi:hypothetical protein FE257_006258 [Aspergillus nanangensis]|uniref:Glycosyl hydrolase family 43 protein n=1 Tax=Aspergillus nanangensis TaxID=2582783 RepID=A0AAD4GUT9_ASPNN|nr:hypothetical protein FE257_006258 [Aspergillus nanangensis]
MVCVNTASLAYYATLFHSLIATVVGQAVGSDPLQFTSSGNPILSDGSWYSADPAPLVVNSTLYIVTGQDTAAADENSFAMPQWGLFSSESPDPQGSDWTLYPDIGDPNTIFSWAAAGTAYASQIVEGQDGKYYLYVSITQADSPNNDPFAVGVAVSDLPTGPYTDAHPAGPIISQSIPSPGNSIQNIDPTVMVDDDGRVYIYFGTFGTLLGYELESDMVTVKGSVVEVTSLTGYFEAPWLMKRGETYYMIYAANNVSPDAVCTPTSYHACQAYGTASSPLGPWTFQGVILPIVSSTTSHAGAVSYDNKWYLVYHTADAKDGGHFRRSVALDELTWDDSATPPKMKQVNQTWAPQPDPEPTRNIAPRASATSDGETPVQYWIKALNDGVVRVNPLPPDMWCSYNGEASPASTALTYTWDQDVQLNGVRMILFSDQPAGSNIGVPPPASWYVEYLDSDASWTRVANATAYPVDVTDSPEEVSFNVVTTSAIRATLLASGDGSQYGGVGIKEWEALAPEAQ